MKKQNIKASLLFTVLLTLFSMGVKAQGYFTVGLTVGGNPYFVSVKDVYIAGTAKQGSNTGSFLVEAYGNAYIGGTNTIIAYGSYVVDPPSFIAPLVLHTAPVSNTSYVRLVNTATTSKSITVKQYYSGILAASETYTLPASTGAGGHAHYITADAAKTYTSRAPMDWYAPFPQTQGEMATYYLEVTINN